MKNKLLARIRYHKKALSEEYTRLAEIDESENEEYKTLMTKCYKLNIQDRENKIAELMGELMILSLISHGGNDE